MAQPRIAKIFALPVLSSIPYRVYLQLHLELQAMQQPFNGKTSNNNSATDEQLASMQTSLRGIHTLFDAVPFAVASLKGPQLIIEYINQYNLDIWKTTKEEVLGKPLFEVRPDIRISTEAIHKEVYRTGKRFESKEVPIVLRQNGQVETRYFDAIIEPMKDELGNVIGQVATSVDVTDKLLTRKKEEDTQHLYALAIEAGALGTFDYFPQTGKLSWSAKTKELFGLTADAKESYDLFLQGVHPDDRQVAETDLQHAMRGENAGYYDNEYRTVGIEDKKLRWIRSRGKVTFNDQGEPWRVTGVVQDATQRKEAEKTLLYRKAILEAQNEAIPDAILIVDTKGNMLSCNRHFKELWQIPEEILKANDDAAALKFAMTQVADPQAFIKRVNECYAHPNQQAQDEILFTDGRIVERYGNAITDNDINYGYIWHFRDITETRHKEEAIKHSEDRYQNFIRQSAEGIWRIELDEPIDINLSVTEQIDLFFKYGYLAECNHSMAKMYGFDNAEDLIGARLDQFFVRDEETTEYLSYFVTSGYNVENAESKERDKNGNIKFFLNNLVGSIENGKLVRSWGTQRDVTSVKTAEEKLKQSEEKYRSLFETMEQGFCLVEIILDDKNKPVDYRFIETNAVFSNQTGLHDALGKTARQLLPGLEQYWFDIYGAVALTGKSARFTEGSEAMGRWFDVYAFRIGNENSRQVAILFSDVSERKKAEKNLQESETRFRSIADEAPAFIFMGNANAEIEYINKTWARFAGLTDEKALGQAWSEITHPDDVQRSYDIYNHAFKTRTAYEYEMKQRGADGEYHWLLWKGIPRFLPNGEFLGILGFGFDMTDIKKAEQVIKQSEAQFRSLANAMPQVVWIAEPGGVVTYYNDRVSGFEGAVKDEDGHWHWQGMVHPSDLHRTEQAWVNAVASGNPYEMEHRIRMTDGTYRWHLSRGIPHRDENGVVSKWYGTATDVHDQKSFSERLEKLVEERTYELQRSNDDLQQFAHVASHDLKEPVRKVMTFSNRLKDELKDTLTEKTNNYLSKIESSAIRMYSMIDGVLLYSSLNALEQTKELIDLDELLQSVEADLEVPVVEKEATISYSGLPSLNGSSVLLYQLFYNLVNNSLKFSKPGVPSIISITHFNVSDDELVDYNLDHKKEFIKLVLVDNGIGFDNNNAEKIFGTFTRLHPKDRYEGTGLGLSLCRKIVERHGGIIKAEGIDGDGASFIIILPKE